LSLPLGWYSLVRLINACNVCLVGGVSSVRGCSKILAVKEGLLAQPACLVFGRMFIRSGRLPCLFSVTTNSARCR
jgi:hypothetical protein